jgi:hypothetical protein
MFKYFNPVWIIKNFLQPSLGPEILVPAAIGAVGSAATGGSPITGALLGGATGGILGGAGGAGGNLFSGFKSALPSAAPSLGSGGYAALAPTASSGIGGAATGGINFTGIGSGLGGTAGLPATGQGINIAPYLNVADDGLGFAAAGVPSTGIPLSASNAVVTEPNLFAIDPRRMAVDTPLTFGERLSDLGSNTMSYAQQNPMTVLGGGQSLLNIRQQNEMANQERLRNAIASAPPIRQGQSGPMAGNLLQVKRIG